MDIQGCRTDFEIFALFATTQLQVAFKFSFKIVVSMANTPPVQTEAVWTNLPKKDKHASIGVENVTQIAELMATPKLYTPDAVKYNIYLFIRLDYAALNLRRHWWWGWVQECRRETNQWHFYGARVIWRLKDILCVCAPETKAIWWRWRWWPNSKKQRGSEK